MGLLDLIGDIIKLPIDVVLDVAETTVDTIANEPNTSQRTSKRIDSIGNNMEDIV